MAVAWGTFSKSDGTAYRQIEVSEHADSQLFERIAELLSDGLRGKWVERLDGLDQRYWDLEAAGGKLTLHLEHYLGITVYPTAGEAADDASLELLRAAHELLTRSMRYTDEEIRAKVAALGSESLDDRARGR
jgi:hypothetical protein